MTTDTYSGPLLHSSDAEFRAWGLALSNSLTAAGFPKSADTGQINWATVTKPGGSNTAAGYEIRYLSDSLHATKPCYVKLEFGNGVNTSIPSIWASAGSGTNGSGTLSGTMFTRILITPGAVTNAGNFPTYACTLSGYVAFAFARAALGSSVGGAFFSVARTCDAAGAPTNTGFYFLYSTGNSSLFNRKTYITSEITDGSNVCLFPGGDTTTLVGSDVQVIRHFGYQPTIRCIPFYLGYMSSEIGNESTFVATPVGVTARTYLALGGSANSAPSACSSAASTSHRLAMQFS